MSSELAPTGPIHEPYQSCSKQSRSRPFRVIFSLVHSRANLASTDLSDDGALPTLDALRWRLDVCISSSSLHRVLRPQLTLQCTLSDQNVHTFHVGKQRFGELRFTAAKCFKEMQDLEARLPPQP